MDEHDDEEIYEAAELALRTINDLLRQRHMSRPLYDALQDVAADLYAAVEAAGPHNYARYPYPWKD